MEALLRLNTDESLFLKFLNINKALINASKEKVEQQ